MWSACKRCISNNSPIKIAVIISAIAFFIRIYNLSLFPLNHDEANWFLQTVNHFNKFAGIPVPTFGGPILSFLPWLIYFTKNIFPAPFYAVRIPTIIIGTATVILTYQLTKDMYGHKAGLVSMSLLSLLPWHVIDSRCGTEGILVPFFGCLIALALIRSLQRQSNFWFIIFWLLLGIGSFYTYRASVIFVPIFFVILLLLRKDLYWCKPEMICTGLLFFYLLLYPLIYLQVTGRIDFLGGFFRPYQENPFSGNVFLSIWENFKNNNPPALGSLFFSSRGRILYGAAFQAPLLIHWISLSIIIFSIIISFWRRGYAEKILLTWLCLGYAGGVLGVSFFQPRYIIVILVPLLILMGRFFSEIFNCAAKKTFFKRRLFFSLGILLCAGLVITEIFQLIRYYQVAPSNLEECRKNSYGCKEAAQYLSRISNIEDYRLSTGFRMTVTTYLKYFSGKNLLYEEREGVGEPRGTYYVLWAPESHPREYWNGYFTHNYYSFKSKYPNKIPVATIYYPNGLPAIYIFKV